MTLAEGALRATEAAWAQLVRHTIVGQPRQSEYMVEAVLCRILMLALKGCPIQARDQILHVTDAGWRLAWESDSLIERPPTLVPGGRWEVDTRLLAPEEEKPPETSTSKHCPFAIFSPISDNASLYMVPGVVQVRDESV